MEVGQFDSVVLGVVPPPKSHRLSPSRRKSSLRFLHLRLGFFFLGGGGGSVLDEHATHHPAHYIFTAQL